MRANLTYAASEPGSEVRRWVFTHGRVVGAGRSGENGKVDTVGSGGVRGSAGAGPGRLWLARRLLKKEVVERDKWQALLAGAKLS